MSEKKTPSRAEKAVSHVKKNANASNSSKSTGKKASASAGKKKSSVPEKVERMVPTSFIIALVSITLFILLVALCVNPEGVVMQLCKSILLGLFGQAGFYFAIPAALYMFIIHTFCRRSAVTMRSVCVASV